MSATKVLCASALLALALTPRAFAGCRAEPMYCNSDTETTKTVIVTCTPKADFNSGGYVVIDGQTVSLQDQGGTATARVTVKCTAGSSSAVTVYKNDGTTIDLGNFQAAKTKKDGTIDIKIDPSKLGTQAAGLGLIQAARERLDIDLCAVPVALTEKDIVAFDLKWEGEETDDPAVNLLTITSLEETFGPRTVCGRWYPGALMTLDPDHVSQLSYNAETGHLLGTLYTISTVPGAGAYRSIEWLSGFYDGSIVKLRFDGTFEPLETSGDK